MSSLSKDQNRSCRTLQFDIDPLGSQEGLIDNDGLIQAITDRMIVKADGKVGFLGLVQGQHPDEIMVQAPQFILEEKMVFLDGAPFFLALADQRIQGIVEHSQ